MLHGGAEETYHSCLQQMLLLGKFGIVKVFCLSALVQLCGNNTSNTVTIFTELVASFAQAWCTGTIPTKSCLCNILERLQALALLNDMNICQNILHTIRNCSLPSHNIFSMFNFLCFTCKVMLILSGQASSSRFGTSKKA